MSHLDGESRERLTVEVMSEEAVTSSEIEGEVLNRDSVQSSIRRQLGLQADAQRASPAEHGIAEMIVALYRTTDQPLDEDTLGSWHEMLMRGRTDLRRVPEEMDAFLDWFHRTAPSGPEPLPALTRAGVAHRYFESIHPFEDGNGRIGRAISEKALAQGLGGPTLTALAATILARHRAYYDMLEASNKRNDIDEWLAWFAGGGLEAQQRTQAQVAFLIDKSKLAAVTIDDAGNVVVGETGLGADHAL